MIIKGKKIKMGEAYVGSTRYGVTAIALAPGTAPVKVGTVFQIQGVSKGKGFAGVVKRWNFAGGPKTHGQSDRERAPGSIGQGTTPGRVRAGKKMAGRMGSDTISMKNCVVVAVSGNTIWVTGPLPGTKNAALRLTETGLKDLGTLKYLTGGLPVEAPVAPVAEDKSEEPKVEEVKEVSNEN